MEKKLRKDRLYVWLLGGISIVAIYGIMGKGHAYPPINLFLERNNAFIVEDTNYVRSAPFWDNFSHWVDVSEGYVLNDSLFKGKGARRIFMRYKPNAYNYFVSPELTRYLKDSADRLVLLVDDKVAIGKDTLLMGFPGNRIFRMSNPLPMPIEIARLSYVFCLDSNGAVSDIYVPRKEISEVFRKYVDQKMKH